MGFKILASAKYVPSKIISNQDLSQMMDTSDEWITKRTGIKYRHQVQDELNIDLAYQVAKSLLQKSQLQSQQIDLIIIATMSPDYATPSVAAMLQGRLNATKAIAFDINSACSGFVYGMQVANQILQNSKLEHAMIIGSEVLTKFLDFKDRSTSVLFGDGAGGILVSYDKSDSQIIDANLMTYGKLAKYLTAGRVATPAQIKPDYLFQMNGRRVYEFATKKVPQSIQQVINQSDYQINDIKYFILHQANARIIQSVAKQLGQPMKKFPMNIQNYGNTAAASEPILLAELLEKKQIQRGDLIVFSGFGGGLTVGTNLLKF